MDAGSAILLCVVAVCVIVLIVMEVKRRNLEMEMIYGEDPDRDLSEDMDEEEEEEEEEEPEDFPPQITIYEYRPAEKIRLCALCDGENDATAAHCHICGQPMK